MNPRRIVRLYEWYKAKTFCCAFFAAAMLAMVAAATIVRFPPVIMCIVKRQFLSLRVTMRHNNGSSTWKGSHFEYLLDAEYNALSIYHGHFPWNISRKTPHNSPVRVRYRVSFVNPKFGQSVTSVIVVLYYRVICGCDISKVYKCRGRLVKAALSDGDLCSMLRAECKLYESVHASRQSVDPQQISITIQIMDCICLNFADLQLLSSKLFFWYIYHSN